MNRRAYISVLGMIFLVGVVRALARPASAPGPAASATAPVRPVNNEGNESQAASAPATSHPSDRIIFQLHWQPQAQFAGYMIALEKGFFREAGLRDVKLEWADATVSPLDLLTKGRTDFCTAWLSEAIRRRERGAAIVNLAQVIRKSAMMLVARANSGITRPEDLNGKRVGLWGGDFNVPPKAFFTRYDIQPVIITQSTSMVPFLRGAVAAASAMQYNEYHKLMEAGLRPEELKVFAFADYGIDFPEDGVYCMEATRRDRPKVCAAMLEAVLRGWAYALSHESETLDTVMSYCWAAHVDTNRNHQRWMLRAMRPLIQNGVGDDPTKWGKLSAGDYAKVTRILRDQGLIRQAPRFDVLYQPPERVQSRP